MRIFATLNHLFDPTVPACVGLPRLREQIAAFARSAEQLGCEGILVFTGNRAYDPWVLTQIILEATTRLRPLIAIQAAYAHPVAAFQRIATLSNVYERRLALNLIAGANKTELDQIGDVLSKEERYERLQEYAEILSRLTTGRGKLSRFEGRYYRIEDAIVSPDLDESLSPELLVSGASSAAARLARALDAKWIHSPCSETLEPDATMTSAGLSAGFIVRDTDAEAWAVADRVFPHHRKENVPELQGNDSEWRRALWDRGSEQRRSRPPVWLDPFTGARAHWRGRRSNHPWLVGSEARLRRVVNGYRTQRNVDTFIVYVENTDELARTVGLLSAPRTGAQASKEDFSPTVAS